MTKFLNTLKNLLTYKAPIQSTGFELLEPQNEGKKTFKDKAKDEKALKQKALKQKPKDYKIASDSKIKRDEAAEKIKKPLNVSRWNEERKNEGLTLPQTPESFVDLDLGVNQHRIKNELNIPQNSDAIIREFSIARKIKAFIVFIDGMVDRTIINDFILRQLMTPIHFEDYKEGNLIRYITDNVLSIHDTSTSNKYDKIVSQVLNGHTALFIEDSEEALLIESRGYEKRSVEKPTTETVVRGSMEGFTENMRTNITLIRRIIKNKNLVTEMLPMGNTNNGTCAMMYINGLTNPKIIKEVKRRVESISKDFIGGDGMLEQLIEDNPLMIFPQVFSTERSDRAASCLTEGKVVLVPEGTPFILVAPATFFHLLHTSEDSFLRWQYGTLLRIVRLLGMVGALFLPALYISLLTYHQEMIPTELLVSIAKTREQVPFPTLIEVLIMEVSFELIREAGVRVPGVIGQTLGIIGALILGQAAVAAGIVSPILIIVVAVTGLGSFAIPNFSLAFAIRIIRFLFIFFAAIAGFYGISAGIFILGSMACSMKSFGVPYFSPVAPRTKLNPDVIVRAPTYKQSYRPDYFNPMDRKRTGPNTRGWTKK